MKILVLTPQLPFPPHKGTALRNFHFLKYMGARHELSLLTFGDPRCEADLAELRRHCSTVEVVQAPERATLSRVVDLVTSDKPDLVRRIWSRTMANRLDHILARERFDLVQIEGLEMALHWEAAVAKMRHRPPVLLDAHNAEHVLQRRAFEIDIQSPARWIGAAYSLVQWQKLARYEQHFCRVVNRTIAASERDRQALLDLDRHLKISVVPNGVDVAHYEGLHRAAQRDGQRVIFVGTLDFRPNVDALLWLTTAVWPLVTAAVPAAELAIVGRNPKPEIARLADGRHISVEPDVADVRPHLARAALTVVPLRIGGGSRLKVLEAMAARVPVVSTTLGCEGIAVATDTAVIADEPASLAQQIVALLEDPSRGERLAGAAFHLVKENYDWSVIGPKLEQAQREAVDG